MTIDLEDIIKDSDPNIEKLPIKDFSERAYLNYSMYVILDRALPHISDGLKPVQRRILYAMSELSLSHTSKFKKSARTIGDVLGKFHPHGDTACYEAMVMLAQPFSYNHPFIEGQGNWGTQDDPKSFAAMRYTESRLTKFADLFLDEIDMGTVKWLPNFDGTINEPRTLPSKIPNILINGSSGIAVGMSTDIPSHNLSEVIAATITLIKDPKTSTLDLSKIIQGPDFPTGGELLSNDSELENIYETGIGNIKLRATFEEKGKEIIINSLPYQVVTNKIIEQVQDQIVNKKSIFIDSVRDESDQDNPVRIILKTKGKIHKANEIMSHLFFTTDLEKSYRVNMNMIGLDGKPQIKNLQGIILEWIEYRLTTIKNKLSFELDKLVKRIHLLEAYIIVYQNLDKIIHIIRNEDNPKVKLQKSFKFTDAQYEAIINMKIRNLAKLQEKNITGELSSLIKDEKKVSALLKSKTKLRSYLNDELIEISKDFSRQRLTKIISAQTSQSIEIKPTISVEPLTVILSKNGWIKSIRGHENDIDAITYKTGDDYLHHVCTSSDQTLAFLDQLGYVYNLDVSQVPTSRGNGEPVSKYFQMPDGITITGMTNISKDKSILNLTTSGYGFICLHNDVIVKNKKGKTLIKTKESKAMMPLSFDLESDPLYLLITSNNYMIISDLKVIPILSKGRGVKLINIPKNNGDESIIFASILKKNQSLISGSTVSRRKIMDFTYLQQFIMPKSRRGKKIDQKFLHKKGKTIYTIE